MAIASYQFNYATGTSPDFQVLPTVYVPRFRIQMFQFPVRVGHQYRHTAIAELRPGCVR